MNGTFVRIQNGVPYTAQHKWGKGYLLTHGADRDDNPMMPEPVFDPVGFDFLKE